MAVVDWRRPFGRRTSVPEHPPAPPERKAAPALALVTGGGRAVWSSRNFEALSREGFARNAVVYRCVRMVAEAAASVPLVAFAEGEKAEADHPVARLLAQPNSEQGGPDLLEAFYGALQVSGNGYLEAVGFEGLSGVGRGVSAGPSPAHRITPDTPHPTSLCELYALRPERMAVVPGARGWAEAYDYSVGGRTRRIGRDADGWLPVLHLKLLNPADDHYGFPPLEAAAFAVDVHNASGAWNKALLDNAARPSGALVYGGGQPLTEEQFQRLKVDLAAAHGGQENAGRPLLLEGGLDWKPMSMSPAEMDFISGKHAAAREIALAFGVPPQLLGIPGDSTYSNYKEANLAFWRGTVAPLAQRTARALTAWLEPKFSGVRIAADLDSVPAMSGEREALWARLEAASFLTVEERRRMAGVSGG